ncbi:hypothetical protein MTO96_003758 [Rhipicephalus appendiculatus]
MALLNHYAPKRMIVGEHYNFHERIKGSWEAVDDFIVELKRLATSRSFGAFLTQALGDQLLMGVRCEAIWCKLSAAEGKGLTWHKACVIATSMEVVEKQAREMLPGPGVA